MTDLLFIFSTSSGEIGLLLIFLYLLACGLGLPFPEEIGLFAAGYLAYLKMISITSAILVPFIGIIAGDMALFTIGNKMGLTLFEHRWFKRVITRKRLRVSRQYFTKYGNRIVFFARFVAGVRAPIFLSAAILRMRPLTFFIIDFIAALVSVPVLVYLAYYFGRHIRDAINTIQSTKLALLGVVVAVVVLYFVSRRLRRRFMQKHDQDAT